MRIVAVARGSRLSIKQVELFSSYARSQHPGLHVEVRIVHTRGDIVRDKPISMIGGVGVFSKEVNNAVLEGRADVGVHSLKDLPTRLPNELDIVMVPPRGPPNDSLVPRTGTPALPPEKLPPGTLVAAGSARRRNMLNLANPRLEYTFIRGNIDTRLRRLDEGRAEYLVAAEAALARLGVDRPRWTLPVEEYVPSPGQGIIAVVARRDSEISRILRSVTHVPTHAEMVAERAFLEAVGAGCGVPIGGYAKYVDGEVEFVAAYYEPDRAYIVRTRDRDPQRAGERGAEVLKRESPL